MFTIGNSIDDFNADKILSLKYLDACVMETLRLRASIPLLSRVCTEDTTLGTLKISKGTQVFIPIKAIQTDPKHFPDPLNYKPERFVHEDPTKHPALYCFGSGPRICLGMRHTLLYLKMALIAVLLNFKIHSVNDFELDTQFFFCVPKPVYLKFESLQLKFP